MAKNVRVAINGFGRIGRLAFRQMFAAEGYEVVAINDLTDAKMLAHLLKYDSAQGRYALADKVEAKDGAIVVDGKEIKIYAEKNAADLPWKEVGVDVVLECTGFYTSKAKAQAHIDAGAKKVVISAPAGNDLPTIVYSVNEKDSDQGRHHHFRGVLHHQLPRPHGGHPQQARSRRERHHDHRPRLHRRPDGPRRSSSQG